MRMMNKMTQYFPFIPAGHHSYKMRKKIYGLGINDANYVTKTKVDGKWATCPYYQVWICMLQRSYSKALHARSPTYEKCLVCEEWLIFSNFKAWMERQDWEGKELDKDILVKGNKTYSPETCVFVTHALNMLLVDRGAARGEYPQGVYLEKATGKYKAQCSSGGKRDIGRFDTMEEAVCAYSKVKSDRIREFAKLEIGILKEALLGRSNEFYMAGQH